MVEIFPIEAVPVKGRGTTKWWKGSIKKVEKKNPPVTCVTAPFNKGAFLFCELNGVHFKQGDLFTLLQFFTRLQFIQLKTKNCLNPVVIFCIKC